MDGAVDAAQPPKDPHEEVRKLQNLVRQLELQNEQLKKQSSGKFRKPEQQNGIVIDENQKIENYNGREDDEEESGEEQLIDVDEKFQLAEEDSWLYSCPKSLTPEQKSVSPYKWLRKDVEDPRNGQLQTVKRGLVRRLDELAKGCRVPNHVTAIVNCHPAAERKFSGTGTTVTRKNIDTRTFTRPKKNSFDFELPIVNVNLNGDVTSPPLPPPLELFDVEDVQNVARQQQESLRQSSPLSSPRRSSVGSSSSYLSGVQSLSPCENERLNDLRDVPMEFRSQSPQRSRGREPYASCRMPQSLQNGVCVPSSYPKQNLKASSNQIPPPNKSSKYSPVQALRSRGTSQSPSRNQRFLTATHSKSRSSSSASNATRGSSSPDIVQPSKSTGGPNSRIPLPKSRIKSGIPTLTRSSLRSKGCNGDESWKDGCF